MNPRPPNVPSMRKLTVAACTLNQWALDFEGNCERILNSIRIAKEAGAMFRSGPELEISGYSCEDHFFEGDTLTHCWEVLLFLLRSKVCENILVDVGMPVMHKSVTYNCRVIFYNGQILLIRPKLILCDDGNYRETRWFTPWKKVRHVEDHYLPPFMANSRTSRVVPFGDAVIATRDTVIGFEICEELWNPLSTHVPMCLDGVEIISNSSGSYMELRKAYITVDLVKSATLKSGGCYMFSNLRGCDGQRTYFNGCSCIALNGSIISRGKQFALEDVEVVIATIDLEEIRNYRNALRSRCSVSVEQASYPRINIDMTLTDQTICGLPTAEPIEWIYHSPQEEIALGPACWLWDYLRRSNQGGFFLPLSGGVDSAATATIVFSMCHLVVESCQLGDVKVIKDVRRIVGDGEYIPNDPKELCNRLFVTCYMGTSNSSNATRQRAMILAAEIGSYQLSVFIESAVNGIVQVFTGLTKMIPKFSSQGGTPRESVALQNVQARVRMVISYLFAQLVLWSRDRAGGLLVLGSANVDEALRGYMTKYDCSSADINPIGGISKTDLRSFLAYAVTRYQLPGLREIMSAVPTAELEPLDEGNLVQTDEQDMGMTYEELSVFGRLRKQDKCGPYSMFCKLVNTWKNSATPEQVAEKVKHFYRCYAINRHKMTVLTPSYHAESYSPDDNRYDLRPFLYNISFSWQFNAIDQQLREMQMTHLSEPASKHEGSTPATDSSRQPPGNQPLGPSGLGQLQRSTRKHQPVQVAVKTESVEE